MRHFMHQRLQRLQNREARKALWIHCNFVGLRTIVPYKPLEAKVGHAVKKSVF